MIEPALMMKSLLVVRCICLLVKPEIPQAGSFNIRNVFSPSPGGWKFKMEVSANLVSPEASLIGL